MNYDEMRNALKLGKKVVCLDWIPIVYSFWCKDKDYIPEYLVEYDGHIYTEQGKCAGQWLYLNLDNTWMCVDELRGRTAVRINLIDC